MASIPAAPHARDASPRNRFPTYEDAEEYLNAFTDYERMVKCVSYPDDLFDLSRIRRLLARVGDPHEALHGIHLAGTKGKGSTAHFLDAVLRGHGMKTGLYTSPHLVTKEERVRVAGRCLSREDFLRWMNEMGDALHALKEHAQPPTFFDILTTVAFLHFRASEVDAAVMEVGLGGRLDSTNVFRPEVCVITRLGLDHTEKLGDRLSQIAAEKAGIVKPGTLVISHPQEAEAAAVLEARCREQGAPQLRVGEEIRVDEAADAAPARFSVRTPTAAYDDLRLTVLGAHQRVNAAAAVAAAEAWMRSRQGRRLDPALVRSALADTRQPGRIEVVGARPLWILDGAHNPVSVDVLLRTVREEVDFERLHVLFSCSKDKDLHGMLTRIAGHVDRWTLTTFDFPRLEDPARLRALLEEIRPGADVSVTRGVAEALEDAAGRSGPRDCIVCCGSFYLVGEIYKRRPDLFARSFGPCDREEGSSRMKS